MVSPIPTASTTSLLRHAGSLHGPPTTVPACGHAFHNRNIGIVLTARLRKTNDCGDSGNHAPGTAHATVPRGEPSPRTVTGAERPASQSAHEATGSLCR